MLKILFASGDWAVQGPKDNFGRPWPGGAGWYRCRLPATLLAEHGHVVRHVGKIGTSKSGEIMAAEMDSNKCEDGFEVVVFQRWMRDVLSDVVLRARAVGQIVIQDVDDWYWGLDPANAAFESSHPGNNPTENREHYRQGLTVASAITVSTPYLAERLHRMVPRVPIYVLRNAIDLDRWEPHAIRWTDKPVIGWVGATAWRSGDLEILKGILGPFVEKHDLHVIHSGATVKGTFAKRTGVDPTRVIERPMASIHLYPLLWSGFDVALAPLREVPFNHAKCVEVGARIPTIDGVRRADSLRVGDVVWSNNGWVHIEATEIQAQRSGVELHTANGRILRVSTDHRMWINGSWAAARSAQPGDSVVGVPGGRTGVTSYISAPWPADSRVSRLGGKSMDFLNAVDGPQVTLNERWGRLLGLFVGDGCVGQNTTVTISCDGQDADLIDLVIDDFRSFGLHSRTEQVTTWSGQILRRRSVGVSSANLVRFLYGLGFVSWSGSENVKRGRQYKILAIPDVIWRSPSSVQAAFLSGLFEADGTCGRPCVSFTTKNETLARDVQILLATFDVETFVKERWNTAKSGGERFRSFLVRTRRAGADVFEKEIGFLSERKRAKLAAITERPHSSAYKAPTWVDVIKSVVPVEIDTIDIQVEGDEFVAEGLRSHNSAIKAMEAAAAGIPVITSDLPSYREFGVGRWAKNASQWLSSLEIMLDPLRREQYRAAALERVAQENIDIRWQEWFDLYAGLRSDKIEP